MMIACGVGALGGALLDGICPAEIDEGWTLCCESAGNRVAYPISLQTRASDVRVVLPAPCRRSARDGESRKQQSADEWRRAASITFRREMVEARL